MADLTTVFTPFIVFLALSAAIGVSLAARPLRRPGYWLRIGLQLIALVAVVMFARILDPFLIESDPDPDSALRIAAGLILFGFYFALLAYGFWLEGRRLIDAGFSKWWALFGALPFAFIVFGVFPSAAPRPPSPDAVAETFR